MSSTPAQDGAVGITALLHKGRIVLIGDTLVTNGPTTVTSR
jgi:malate dehydrogenase (oxaloacetate-decarboxylating)(NADP+)